MLIGRKGERASLEALAEGAVRGQGAALLVTGEPGMGKTMPDPGKHDRSKRRPQQAKRTPPRHRPRERTG